MDEARAHTANVGVVVLAAGRGSRFGTAPHTSKALAKLDGITLLRRVTETALASRGSPVVVVTGHAAAAVSAAIFGLPVETVHNNAAATGLASSIQVGLAALPPEVRGALVLLADMPLVKPETLDRLIARFDSESDLDAVVPQIDGRAGNPVLLGRTLFDAVKSLTGDQGARKLLAEDGRRVVLCDVDDPGIEIDVDTPDALRAISPES